MAIIALHPLSPVSTGVGLPWVCTGAWDCTTDSELVDAEEGLGLLPHCVWKLGTHSGTYSDWA